MLRKIFMFLTLLCCSSIVVNAASYDIQVTVSTQKTNCYTDGKIFVKLSGADLGVLEASDQITFDVIKNGKSYKQHDLTFADMRADSIFVLEGYPAGTYSLNYSIWIVARHPPLSQLQTHGTRSTGNSTRQIPLHGADF